MSGPEGGVLIVGVGASQGLGAAIARRFAAAGHPVAVAGRNAEKLEATVAELKASGARVAAVVGDATKAEDARRFVAEAQALAPLACGVHNAGGNRPSPFLQVTAESFETHWREHALGGFHLAQAALPALLVRSDTSKRRRRHTLGKKSAHRPDRSGMAGFIELVRAGGRATHQQSPINRSREQMSGTPKPIRVRSQELTTRLKALLRYNDGRPQRTARSPALRS
ncbi:MAG TPA: SDR family NAD(P)-dependent oxidoreductase [Caulobacteraceae bacterium]|nr:SDR family NAD(P)-dependent oxidoreductase [Caulobacteraceae bacterium]